LAAHPADRAAAGLAMVIPPLVNNFIGAFKNTALVLIIGLFDLLNTANTALTDAIGRASPPRPTSSPRRSISASASSCRATAKCSSAPSTGAIALAGAEGSMSNAAERIPAAAASTASIIEMQAVHKWYGEFHVLKDINLVVGGARRSSSAVRPVPENRR